MDLGLIRYILADIERDKKDFESAHAKEDYLYHEFVKHVSKQDDELGEMAKEILKSLEIDFQRVCS